MIHIVNGDCVGKKLQNHIDGDIIVWREMYDFGPLTNGCSEEELIKQRAIFFEKKVGIPASKFIENCKKQNRLLCELVQETEITLWFEHDRYDQTMLMYLLNELSRKGLGQLSMVTLNEYPGIEPFFGLGQLSTAQLIELFHHRKQSVSDEQVQEASTGWTAYTSNTPYEIEKWIATSKHPLPFLKQAMQTHLSYFPSVRTGLNDIEYLVLSFIANQNCSFTELFQSISEQRTNDGLSDLHFAAMVNQLMMGKYPLLESDAPLPTYHAPQWKSNINLTSFGLDVLNRRRDRFELMGMDWWLGGVHLQDDQWRWDGEKIISY